MDTERVETHEECVCREVNRKEKFDTLSEAYIYACATVRGVDEMVERMQLLERQMVTLRQQMQAQRGETVGASRTVQPGPGLPPTPRPPAGTVPLQ